MPSEPRSDDSYAALRRYRPDVVEAYLTQRGTVARPAARAALEPKVRELILLAVQCARPHSGDPQVHHAVRAIDEGGTVAEVADVVAICAFLAGMWTYQQTGKFAIEAAEERARARGSRSPRGANVATRPKRAR